MTFKEILDSCFVSASPEGHLLSVPSRLEQGEGLNEEYLNHASSLYQNPVLKEEITKSIKALMEGLMVANPSNPAEVWAIQLTMKALLSFYDTLKFLHDRAQEERLKKEELRRNPEAPGLTNSLDEPISYSYGERD